MHIQSKLLQRMFVVNAVSGLGQPFHPRQKKLGWGKNRLFRYDIHTEGALPPSITNSEIKKHLDYWICNVSLKRINFKIEIYMRFEFNEGDCNAMDVSKTRNGLLNWIVIYL